MYKICVWDATERGALFLSWRIGSSLFKGAYFDLVQPIRSWGELARLLVTWRKKYGYAFDLQMWGHGSAGSPRVGGKGPPGGFPWHLVNGEAADTGRVWFRMCDVARGGLGKAFIATVARDVEVLAHTDIIGPFQPGLVGVARGGQPWWSADPGPRFGLRGYLGPPVSGSRMVPCLQMVPPAEAFHPGTW